MKPAIEWLNEMGETVATAMFSRKQPPGTEVEELIKRIQEDAQLDTEKTLVSRTEVLKGCEDFLRSVLAVANRRGNETNWDAFEKKTKNQLKDAQVFLGWNFVIEGGDTCTSKTFRAPMSEGSHETDNDWENTPTGI